MQSSSATLEQRKARLRKVQLAERGALSVEARARVGTQLQARLLASEPWATAELVVAFFGVREEWDTRALLGEALDQGKALYLPRVEGRGMRMLRVRDRAELEGLAPRTMGIPEPEAEAVDDLGARREPGLVLYPGLAFDDEGGRLGYGGGYYDRFSRAMAGHLGPRVRVGVCPPYARVERVPRGPGDEAVAWLLTTSGLIACTR